MLDKNPEPLRVVVIAAHADDIEFGCAGSVAKWVNEGAAVTYVLITDGSSGSNDPDTDLDELVATRQREQNAAAAAVGVQDVRYLGYKDGTLQATLNLRRDLTRILREVKPYRVVCQDPTTVFVNDFYINHPDHRAAGEAAVYAVFPSSESRPIFPELLAEGLEPHKVKELYLNLSEQANHFEDISSTIDQKIEALGQHASQLGEEALKMVKSWNAETGKEAGYEYAERFRVMKLGQRNEEKAEETTEAAPAEA